MLFIAITVFAGVLMYLFVQRVVVMKPVVIKGVDEAIDQLIEIQRKKGRKARSWESTTLSEHTMELIDSLEATTCPTEQTQSTATARSSAAASTAVSMCSEDAAAAKRVETPLKFDKTFDPKEAQARKEEAEKKHHRHHHKRHHRHRSREEKERERSSEASEEGDGGKGSKRGHKKHRRHRSKGAVARLDTPLLVAGETMPGPDAVDVEVRGEKEAVKTP